jgi:hypothetical protein
MMPIKCMGQELKLTKTMNDSIKLCHEKVFGANFDMEKPILKEIKKKAMVISHFIKFKPIHHSSHCGKYLGIKY